MFGHDTTHFGLDISNPFIPNDIATVFDDNATRNIFDSTTTGTNGNAAPYVGHFRPEFGSLNTFLKQVAAAGDLNGTWTLKITDFRTETTLGNVRYFGLQFTTGMTPSPTANSIASNFSIPVGSGIFLPAVVIHGAPTGNFPVAAPSSPVGVGPGMVLAIDNTLGPNSPHHGRIYAAFVGYINFAIIASLPNPTTNTDIFLTHSDDGGQTWSTPTMVNADQSTTTGYTQANSNPAPQGSLTNQVTGRTQFQPEIAVDQVTGTVVLSWRDARDDAANARVATYLTTSIDGGQTFGAAAYANPDKVAVDAITGKTQVFGPQADNQSGGNGQRDTGFGYGNQMGLAVFDGQRLPGLGRQLQRQLPQQRHRHRQALEHLLSADGRSPPGRGSSTARWGRSPGPM